MKPLRKVGMRETILALDVESLQGHALMLAFLRDVSAGKVPHTPAIIKLAHAFEAVVFEKAEPLEALGLKRGRGKKIPLSSSAQEKRDEEICEFLWSRLKKAGHRRGALSRALDEAEVRFNRKDRRSIETVWARNKAFYEYIRHSERMRQLRDRYLTTEEWERMKYGPAIAVDRVVLKRAKTKLK